MSVIVDDAYIWAVVCGFIISFVLALGIGANDVANSFATSVGAGVLTLNQACVLASIFETAGAVLLGGKVSETVRKGIIDTSLYENSTQLFLAGNVAALSGSCVWLFIATVAKLPVSTSHSIIGATVGYALVAHGTKGIDWVQLGGIVISWFISPIASGLVSLGVFLICEYFILRKEDPMEPGLRWLHIFYGVTVFINFFSIFLEGPEMLYFHRIPLWGTFVIASGAGIITAIAVRGWLVPWQRKKIKQEMRDGLHLKKDEDEDEDEDGDGDGDEDNEGGEEGGGEGKDIEDDPFDPDIDVKETVFTIPLGSNGEKIEMQTTKALPGMNGVVDGMTPIELTAGAAALDQQGKSNPAFDGGTDNPVNAVEPANTNNSNNTDATTDGAQADTDSQGGLRQRAVSTVSGANGSIKEQPLDANSLEQESRTDGDSLTTFSGESEESDDTVFVLEDRYEEGRIFAWLMILTACFGSFAHGGNDVANAIAPFVSIWLTATSGEVENDDLTPLWCLVYGSAGIAVGLWLWGSRVIETVGGDLTKMNPSSGFSVELGAACTVLVASNMGLPISTTHCKVGSIVFVGYYRTRNVNWKLFGGIFFAWCITLPVAGCASAAFMAFFMIWVPDYDWE